MTEYIEREKIEKFFDGIYDCADLVFEPNDHCCASDDCGHCKWYEAKEAIQKRILSIPAADVREVKRGKWKDVEEDMCLCTSCRIVYLFPYATRKESAKVIHRFNFCPNCGADMR